MQALIDEMLQREHRYLYKWYGYYATVDLYIYIRLLRLEGRLYDESLLNVRLPAYVRYFFTGDNL